MLIEHERSAVTRLRFAGIIHVERHTESHERFGEQTVVAKIAGQCHRIPRGRHRRRTIAKSQVRRSEHTEQCDALVVGRELGGVSHQRVARLQCLFGRLTKQRTQPLTHPTQAQRLPMIGARRVPVERQRTRLLSFGVAAAQFGDFGHRHAHCRHRGGIGRVPLRDAQKLFGFFVCVHTSCAIAGGQRERVRLHGIVGAIEVHRDLRHGIGRALAQGLRHSIVCALQSARIERLGERLDQQRVHEHISITAAAMRRLNHTCTHATLDGVVERLGRHAGGVLHHAKVELTTDDRGNGQHVAICGAEFRETSSHQIEHTDRQAQFGHRVPVPSILVPPDVAFVDECAQRLHHEQRIAFGLPVEIGEEFALDLLAVERGVDPAAQLVARQPRECLFVNASIVHQLAHAFVHFRCHILHPEREAEQHRFVLELRDDMFECIPAGGVGAVQIIEHNHEWPAERGFRDVAREFHQQRELAASGHRRGAVGGVQAGHDARQFRPACPVNWHDAVLRRWRRQAHAACRGSAVSEESRQRCGAGCCAGQ